MRRSRARGMLLRWARVWLGPALVLQGCSSSPDELTVLAAASLGASFQELAREFEAAHPGSEVRLSVAGTQILAAQLRAGVRAQVIASANESILFALEREGRVLGPQRFASNRIVCVFRRAAAPSPAEPLALALTRGGLRFVLAAPEVPAGQYARTALEGLGVRSAVEQRLVSQELDVTGVLAKVRLEAADGGLVYFTDVAQLDDPALVAVELPPHAQVAVHYAIARTLHEPAELSSVFIRFVLGSAGQELLRGHGFEPVR